MSKQQLLLPNYSSQKQGKVSFYNTVEEYPAVSIHFLVKGMGMVLLWIPLMKPRRNLVVVLEKNLEFIWLTYSGGKVGNIETEEEISKR